MDNILEFNGQWRTYQKDIIDHYDLYKHDNKIHIVAAPGSGKTTIGIELIKRVGHPVLVLVPTLTIRAQWVQRIKDSFLKTGLCIDDYVSQDLKNLKLINIATYQSVHSAMTMSFGRMEEENDFHDYEDVDFQEFDLIQALKNQKIGTLCLDECHHLRSEWWKTLENIKKQLTPLFTISLTATPPYDDSPTMWKRYIDLCGEIDVEITVPELVKEGSLCPHQDYVYFNYPTNDERQQINVFQQKSQMMFEQLMSDQKLKDIIQTHNIFHNIINYDRLLEKPEYLSSLLIYCESQNIEFSSQFQNVLGYKKLEKMSIKWMQILLQGLLYDDVDSYQMSQEIHEGYIKQLKSKGFIEKKQVVLEVNQAFRQLLVKSKGKCKSIQTIVFHEYQYMKEKLRLVILTDYIRGEYEKAVGDDSQDVYNLGAVPFFEMLRREVERKKSGLKLGVLCGSIVVIPASAKNQLLEIIGNDENIEFKKFGELSVDDYVKVIIHGNKHFIVDVISQLFEMGFIHVLIGTKSLLGEGWDAPCVNTLILASFVGSFMLSNQMRGRAIRTYQKDSMKSSHVWHLVCVEPQLSNNLEESLDFMTLSKRMDHFLGLNDQENVIENGIYRLQSIRYPLNKHNIRLTNQAMLAQVSQRDQLKQRWDQSLTVCDQVEVVEEVEIKERLIVTVLFQDVLRHFTIFVICMILSLILCIGLFPLTGLLASIYIGIYVFLFTIGICYYTKKIFMFKNPLARLKVFGQGILNALQVTNQLQSQECQVKAESNNIFHMVYLDGGTGHDKSVFAKCVYEFYDALDNQRYILYSKRRAHHNDGYFVVPSLFAKKKEDAQIFAQYMKPYIGKYEVVYTRNEEGRKILLEGRIHALANKQERCLTKKKVKGALE